MTIKEAKLHLIQPMAGGGTRFKNNGILEPKPLIDLYNHPFFYYSINSITKNVDIFDLTFAVLREHIDKFNIDIKVKNYSNEINKNCHIQIIDEVLNGAVLTCIETIKQINDDMPILFNDCDHAFISNDFYDFCRDEKFDEIDSGLLTFISDKPCYSYAKINDKGYVEKTVEKEVVSNQAICGAYYFRNKNIFIQYANSYLVSTQ